MTEVFLHVYDVANSDSVKTNNAILHLNKIFKDGIGLGGVFHSAIEVYNKEEWSFGYCEVGSGVFSCQPKKNPMYVYRESLSLGRTELSRAKVREILLELSRKWQGQLYDLLSRNCNHFCNDFATMLGVQNLPAWVNRFANAGETALEVAETTSRWFRTAKTEVASASKVAYRTIFGEPSASSGSSSLEFSQSPTSVRQGGNILQLPFIKTPTSLMSKMGIGSTSQSTINGAPMTLLSKMGIGSRSANGKLQGESSPSN